MDDLGVHLFLETPIWQTSHYLQGFIYVRWVFAGFLPSTVSLESAVGKKKSDLLWGLNQLMVNG